METGQQHMLLEALDHLRAALELLDRASAPAQIGANVDLAIHHLGSTITTTPAASTAGVNQVAVRR